MSSLYQNFPIFIVSKFLTICNVIQHTLVLGKRRTTSPPHFEPIGTTFICVYPSKMGFSWLLNVLVFPRHLCSNTQNILVSEGPHSFWTQTFLNQDPEIVAETMFLQVCIFVCIVLVGVFSIEFDGSKSARERFRRDYSLSKST